MKEELKKYLIEQCRVWMLPEEIKALKRIGLSKYGEKMTRKIALTEPEMERLYGFQDIKTNQLASLDEEELEIVIALRLLKDHENELINKCPKCNALTRTPKAKQCRHCSFDWH